MLYSDESATKQVEVTLNGPVTDLMSLTEGLQTDDADRFKMVWDFNLYFAARTVESKNGSEATYVQRAQKDWKFDGSGTVGANGTWTGTSANSGSRALAPVTSGKIGVGSSSS